MNLTIPIRVSLAQAKMTRKALLAHFDSWPELSIVEMINRFKLEPATALRRRVGDTFPRNFNEVLTFKTIAVQEYGRELPVEQYLKALSLIVRMKDENLLYITSDRSTVMLQK